MSSVIRKIGLIQPILLSLILASCVKQTGGSGVIPFIDNDDEDISVFEELRYIEKNGLLCLSHAPGVYEEEFCVKLGSKFKKAEIYFSRIPGAELCDCEKFVDPIPLKKDTLFSEDDYIMTKSVNGKFDSYLLQSESYYESIQKNGSYPLISHSNFLKIYVVLNGEIKFENEYNYLITENDVLLKQPIFFLNASYKFWFDPDDNVKGEGKGLYNCIAEDNSIRADMFYCDKASNQSFSVNTQVKLGGAMTKGYPQHTLNLNFKKNEYGVKQGSVDCNLFHGKNTSEATGKNITSYCRLRLWNRGNCYPANKYEGNSLMNDVICQSVAKDLNLKAGTTSYDFCQVFLNGEYWGSYILREKVSTEFIQSHYGVNKDDVIIYKSNKVDDGDEKTGDEHLNEMFDYLDTYDLSEDNNYKYFIDKYIDIDSYCDWINYCGYCGLSDFIKYNNNNVMWYSTKKNEENEYSDGKLRFVYYDMDSTLTVLGDGVGTLNPSGQSYHSDKLFNNLCKSNNFRNYFKQSAIKLLKTQSMEENLCNKMHEIVPVFLESWDMETRRWGIDFSLEKANNYLDRYATISSVFFKNRTDDYLGLIDKYILNNA